MGLDPYHAFLTIRAAADYVEAMSGRDEIWNANGCISEAIEQNRNDAAVAGHSTLTNASKTVRDDYLEAQFKFGLKAIASGLTAKAID